MAVALVNRVEVARLEFNSAIARFAKGRWPPQAADLTFENGILSIKVDNAMVTMRAGGQWHGSAFFGGQAIAALAKVPPVADPVIVEYRDGRIRLGPLSVGCMWTDASEGFIEAVENPGVLDLLALGRSMPAAEIHRSGLWRRINRAKGTVTTAIEKAMRYLDQIEITEAELYELVERRIAAKLAHPPR